MSTAKTISSLIRMDEETKRLLQNRANDHGLSESGYIRMLIRKDSDLMIDVDHHSGRAKKTMLDLFREIRGVHPDDIIEMKPAETKELLKVIADKLNERERSFVLERYSEGLTYKQIGQRNSLGQERVRIIIMKSLTKLRGRRSSLLR